MPPDLALPTEPEPPPILLYDGVCGMCQATVRWLLHRDSNGRLRFAAQQSAFAAEILARHVIDKEQVDSAVLVLSPGTRGESILLRSNAILGCLEALGGGWALLARVARLVPRMLRDAAYRLLARYRLRLFGTAELCALPTAAERARFLGV